jgi:hypothetical protein
VIGVNAAGEVHVLSLLCLSYLRGELIVQMPSGNIEPTAKFLCKRRNVITFSRGDFFKQSLDVPR